MYFHINYFPSNKFAIFTLKLNEYECVLICLLISLLLLKTRPHKLLEEVDGSSDLKFAPIKIKIVCIQTFLIITDQSNIKEVIQIYPHEVLLNVLPYQFLPLQ